MRHFFPTCHIYPIVLSYSVFNPSRVMSHLPKVFVKHVDAEEKLKIYFTLCIPELPERLFTFMRPKAETLEITMSRMKLKIVEAIKTKLHSKRRKKKLDKDSVENADQFPISMLLLKEGELLNEAEINVDAWTENTQLKINDHTYEVSLNPPSVLHLSLPKSVMSGFPVYPRIELEFCSKDECEFTWYRSLSKSEKEPLFRDDPNIVKIKSEYWYRLCSNFFYITHESDVGSRLRISCVPKCGEKVGLEDIAVTTNYVDRGPYSCPFEDRHEYTKELNGPGRFRCVSYNILADLYADSDTARNELFPYCPPEVLMLDYRKQLYLKEIIGYNADIICLQEVDRKVFHHDLIPVLTSTGLDGIYNEKGGQVVEGLACFYRTSKFKIIESHARILSEAVLTEPVLKPILSKLNENDKLKERYMKRTTALQVVLLESLDVPQKRILVGNTHLYFRPISDNIRLLQAATCLSYFENILQKLQKEDPSYTISLVLSGDFNSCPENGVHQLITTGSLSDDYVDWKSNPEEIVPGLPLSHSLALGSACGTPAYTNYTVGFVGCLDYIFYDMSHLTVNEVVPFPKHEQVTKYKGLPSRFFPSDHIALICTLQWKL